MGKCCTHSLRLQPLPLLRPTWGLAPNRPHFNRASITAPHRNDLPSQQKPKCQRSQARSVNVDTKTERHGFRAA